MMSIFSILFLLVQFVFASEQFSQDRDDFNIPAHCEEWSFEQFSQEVPRFYYGREGSKKAGYTLEYPLKRDHATILWKYFAGVVKGTPSLDLYRKISDDSELYTHYKVIMANYTGMGVSFGNEGDVLEVLATVDLRNRFPAPVYYISGGVEYREYKGSNTIGEIDVFVGQRSDCRAVAIGEVKLGMKALSKARQQVDRFSQFLGDNGAATIGREIESDEFQNCSAAVSQN